MQHSTVKIAAVIPARMASTRFPGKPLLPIRGLPMVEHVRRRVLSCPAFSEVVVATCDHEIAQAVEGFGGRVVMTAASHPGATDRVAEAARRLDCTHVVNVQGDELLVLPEDLERMAAAVNAAPDVEAWNAVARIERCEELGDRSIVKCAVSHSGRILFCARDVSRLPLGEGREPMRCVLGILGYRRDFLARYGTLTRTPLELAESIDQSRIIEHDVTLRSVTFSRGYPGINEPREVAMVERILDADPGQRLALQRILSLDAVGHMR